MNTDDLLNQPLESVRDDGFSVGVVRRLYRAEQRMRFIIWGLVALGLAPFFAVLPFLHTGIVLTPQTTQFLNNQMAYPLGVLAALFWVWKPRFSRL
jgi:hypothetical protein